MSAAPKIIDTTVSLSVSEAQSLRTLGVESVFGYLNPLGQSGKTLTPARSRALAAAGLRLGLVSEGWGDFAHNSISSLAGTRDGQSALRNAPLLGAPSGATIYFAIDVDASWGQIATFVLPYFEALLRALDGHYAVGVYGSGAVCESVLTNKLVRATWLAQSMGWLRSREFADWTLRQGMPTKLAGIPCDPNVAQTGALVGDFVPFAEVAGGT